MATQSFDALFADTVAERKYRRRLFLVAAALLIPVLLSGLINSTPLGIELNETPVIENFQIDAD